MSTFTIGLVLPDVLGTYGDDGNALVLRQRARLRGMDAEIIPLTLDRDVPDDLDVYTVGGGEDIAQILAAEHLISDGGLTRAVAAGRPVLAICAGMQVFGEHFRAAQRDVQGLGLLDIATTQLGSRMIGELQSEPSRAGRRGNHWVDQLTEPLTGFANHMGATVLGPDAQPLGKLTRGTGNTDAHGLERADGAQNAQWQISAEGAVQGSIIATYMHGPALARNPQLADLLLAQAQGITLADLPGVEADQLNQEISVLRRQRLQ